jgi:putative NADPH-quinone reductase
LPTAVTDKVALLDRADLLVLQYPLWWRLLPAMLKCCFDRVLAYVAVYTSKMRFENGAFAVDLAAALPQTHTRATIPFNRMEDWGEDGRIRPGAPVFSPFVRRKQRLDLE